jgi:uncharacterized protein with NAD-binding domain and iron-sulfur cluster
VAVVGGGCAALTAAFELTRPEQQGRYEVTVYQMGWRLGGKGASGRGPSDRIEEHGLHLWMGFYENAFRLMRECYAERHAAFPHHRFADWREAFKPAPDVAVADRCEDGWEFWHAHFPPGKGEPGDPSTGDPFTVIAYLRQSVVLLGELLRSAADKESRRSERNAGGAANRGPVRGPDALADAISALFRFGQLATAAAVLEASEILREALEGPCPQMFHDSAGVLFQAIDGLSSAARRELDQLVAGDTELRRVWQVIDLILAILRGSIRCGLATDPRGFDAVNDYDWRDWLRLHGAAEPSLDSGFMRGIYDLAFAFEDGDVERPRLAAGVALRGAMRMFFTYRGSLFWRMSAGMGDVVFAPLYQVLKRRGVRFEFFHRLRNLALPVRGKDEAPFVETLQFDVQARVKGKGEYQPLVEVHNLPSWPSQPDYSQLAGGAALKREKRAFEAPWETRHAGSKTLRVGRDFDFVVLGVSIAALPDVAPELLERSAAWRDMVRHVKTVPTQAFQLWMKNDLGELGWPHGSVNLSGFVEPFDTWADMSHLIPEESWNERVKSVAYFCSVLPDAAADGRPVTQEFQREQSAIVRDHAVDFLSEDVAELWPRAKHDGGGFRWGVLAGEPSGKKQRLTNQEGFETQYWTANVNPTDRYVQSLPGSIMYRISPLDMTFDNLTIAGDWTATGLDTGCIESAVMSGLLASHAISQKPPLEDIIGYDHP